VLSSRRGQILGLGPHPDWARWERIEAMLPEAGLHIVGEHFVRVRHCLLGLGTLAEVRGAQSHPQALGQCRQRLRGWGIEPIGYFDTAGAAAAVADAGDVSRGAVASKLAGELYGLDILAEGIEDAEHNTTRFVVLAREAVTPVTDPAKLMTTVMFEVHSVPAALYKALGGFATNGVNMTKLESYQQGTSFAATTFYADIIGAPGDAAVDRALEECAFHSKELRILGSYEQGRARG
jgi:prephenate dehydratase